MQREAFENEDGAHDHIVPDSAVETCIDKCSSHYITTQLDDSYKTDQETGVISGYRNMKLEPEIQCIDGCRCPTGVGTQLIVSDNDLKYDDYWYADEPDRYEITFSDTFGNADAGFLAGYLIVIRDETFPSILLVIKYTALHVQYEVEYGNYGKYGATSEKELTRTTQPFECGIRYYVASGKVGGLASRNNGTTAGPVPYAQTTVHGMVEMVSDQAVDPGSGCTIEEFQQHTHEGDWCTYRCIQSFLVDGEAGVVVLTPSKPFNGIDCVCPLGKGMLVGNSSSHAQIAFAGDSEKVCTSEFEGEQHLVDFQAQNEEYGGGATMQVKMQSGAVCTFEYAVVSGSVLSVDGPGVYDTTAAAANKAVLAIIVSVIIVVLFIAPTVYKDKFGYSTAIYLMSRREHGPVTLPATIYGTAGGTSESLL